MERKCVVTQLDVLNQKEMGEHVQTSISLVDFVCRFVRL